MNYGQQFTIFVIAAIVLEGTNAKPPSRVVGGDDGEIGEFPYIAFLKSNKRNEHVCGGTIIGKRHILTACHCIVGVSDNPAKEMTVVTGTNSVASGAGITHAIKEVVLHPDHSNTAKESWKNDIAIIALTKDIVFDFFSKPALLPKRDTPEDWRCVASGWGDMSYPKGLQPNNVRKTDMTTMSNANCRKAYQVTILDTHLCAFEGLGVGLCTGDSGGPLVHDGTVVGIASFVIPCARGIPDVFTRVYSYIDFIEKAIRST